MEKHKGETTGWVGDLPGPGVSGRLFIDPSGLGITRCNCDSNLNPTEFFEPGDKGYDTATHEIAFEVGSKFHERLIKK